MPAARTILALSGGICVVVGSFVATSYFLNRFSPSSDTSTFTLAEQIVTQATTINDLPAVAKFGDFPVTWTAIDGLNISPVSEAAVNPGQPVLKLVTIPTQGGHNLTLRISSLQKDKVYSIAVLLKPQSQTLTFVQVHDKKPTNYGILFCDLAGHKIFNVNGAIVSEAIELERDGWSKLKLALRNADGFLDVTLGFVSAEDATVFKGDGQAALTFGGIEATPQG
jgi:hypothetical protein